MANYPLQTSRNRFSSLSSCIIAAIQTNGNGKGTTAGITDCFNKNGLSAFRNLCKDASCGCCFIALAPAIIKLLQSYQSNPSPSPFPATASQ
jgi:hypothetical protein